MQKSWMVTKSLLEATSHETQKRLLALLGPANWTEYERLPALAKTQMDDWSLDELLGKIHPSHFTSLLVQYPQEQQMVYLCALPDFVKKEVAASLQIADPSYEYNALFQNWLQEEILHRLSAESGRPLPLSLLPDYPLLSLVHGDAIELSTLCSFLGLFDLHSELKQLIDAKLFKLLEDALSDEEALLLREIGGWRAADITFESLGLNGWNGDIPLLRGVLRERGIHRLAVGLLNAPNDLLWIVQHRMDRAMAAEFRKYRRVMHNHEIVEIILRQIEYCWERICTHSH